MSTTKTILPPPPDSTVDPQPANLRPVRCPACGEIHYRPSTVRDTPLPKEPRTDTVPSPRKR